MFLSKHFVNHDLGIMQPYLRKPIQNNIRKHISRIRLSSHCLNVEIGRYQYKNRQDRLCESCTTQQIEDEFHFVLQCPKYVQLRKKYLNVYYYKSPSTFKLLQLLGSRHIPTLVGLGKYILHALMLRNNELSS